MLVRLRLPKNMVAEDVRKDIAADEKAIAEEKAELAKLQESLLVQDPYLKEERERTIASLEYRVELLNRRLAMVLAHDGDTIQTELDL